MPSGAERNWAPRLEAVLDSKLDDAIVAGCRRDLPEGGRADGVPGLIQLRLVEDVEGLRPELAPLAPREIDVLEQRQVGPDEAGPAYRVATKVAGPFASLCKRPSYEAAGIEPFGRCLRPFVGIARDVGPR